MRGGSRPRLREIEQCRCSLGRRELAKGNLASASTLGLRPAVKGLTVLGMDT